MFAFRERYRTPKRLLRSSVCLFRRCIAGVACIVASQRRTVKTFRGLTLSRAHLELNVCAVASLAAIAFRDNLSLPPGAAAGGGCPPSAFLDEKVCV